MKSLLAAIVSVACLATLAMLTPDEADGGIFGRWRATSCANGSCATPYAAPIETAVEVTVANDPIGGATLDAHQVRGVDNDPMGLVHDELHAEYEVIHNGPVAKAFTAPARAATAPVRFVANRQPLRRALRRVGGLFCRR